MPGAQEAIESAKSSGYEAVVLVVTMLIMLGLMAFIFRWFVNSMNDRLKEAAEREARMATRITDLEKTNETVTAQLIRENMKIMSDTAGALSALRTALEKRICMVDGPQQTQLVETIAERVAERVQHG